MHHHPVLPSFLRTPLRLLLALFALLGFAVTAHARVDIRIDLQAQRMYVASASGNYVWPISSARSGFNTPRGSYGVQRMEVMHRSHKYHNSPMPHSLFFKGGYAIHGTYSVGALGRPASHGCVRIAPGNAAALYGMVKQEGARITIRDGMAPQQGLYADRTISRTPAKLSHQAYAAVQKSAPALRGSYDGATEMLGYAPMPTPDTALHHWWLEPGGQ